MRKNDVYVDAADKPCVLVSAEVATAPLAMLPGRLMPELPGIIRRRYVTTVNRWDTMSVPVDSLHRVTGGEPGQSLLHREVLGQHGIGDIASLVFRDARGCWGFLDLWRSATDERFSDRELGVLDEDVPTITDALRRCQARAFDAPVAGPGSATPASHASACRSRTSPARPPIIPSESSARRMTFTAVVDAAIASKGRDADGSTQP
jgi:hypothetical protein